MPDTRRICLLCARENARAFFSSLDITRSGRKRFQNTPVNKMGGARVTGANIRRNDDIDRTACRAQVAGICHQSKLCAGLQFNSTCGKAEGRMSFIADLSRPARRPAKSAVSPDSKSPARSARQNRSLCQVRRQPAKTGKNVAHNPLKTISPAQVWHY